MATVRATVRRAAASCFLRSSLACKKAKRALIGAFAGCLGKAAIQQDEGGTRVAPPDPQQPRAVLKKPYVHESTPTDPAAATPQPLVPYSDTEGETTPPLGATPGTTALAPYVPTPAGYGDGKTYERPDNEDEVDVFTPIRLPPEMLALIEFVYGDGKGPVQPIMCHDE